MSFTRVLSVQAVRDSERITREFSRRRWSIITDVGEPLVFGTISEVPFRKRPVSFGTIRTGRANSRVQRKFFTNAYRS